VVRSSNLLQYWANLAARGTFIFNTGEGWGGGSDDDAGAQLTSLSSYRAPPQYSNSVAYIIPAGYVSL
jgi:hypothetical protein